MSKEPKRRNAAVRPDDARNKTPASPRSPKLEFDTAWLEPPTKLTNEKIGDCIDWLNYNLTLIPERERKRARQLRHAFLTERLARRRARTLARKAAMEAERLEAGSLFMRERLIAELDKTFVAVAHA